MSQYVSEYPPDTPVADSVRKFFETFYQASDNPEAHEAYTKFYTEDATLIMASKHVKGREEILQLRKAMWANVATRSHAPLKIFPFGPNSNEVMLYGTVDYVSKAGKESGLDWAARAHLVEQGGGLKLKFYQVYLDSGAPQK